MRKGLKRKNKRGDDERLVLLAMIVSKRFLDEFSSFVKLELFTKGFARKVASWCLEYYRQYKDAPGKNIEDIYKTKKRKELDEDEAEIIGKFLSSLSEEYERTQNFNVQYVLDKAENLMAARSLDELVQDIKTYLSEGKIKEARNVIVEYKIIKRPATQGIDPLTNIDALYDAFERGPKPLFHLPGALGDMVDHHLTRDALVAFMGREKIGKTFLLYDIARRAVRANCNVAIFAAGDLSQHQSVRRLAVGLCGTNFMEKYAGKVLEPVIDCLHNQRNECRKSRRVCNVGLDIETEVDSKQEIYESAPPDYVPCSMCLGKKSFVFAPFYREVDTGRPLTWRKALKMGKKFVSSHRRLKLASYSNNTLSVHGIEMQLDLWEAFEDFVPDVIIIDYADILTTEKRLEPRHAENEKWKELRALSQKKHCLIITATQADAASYDKQSLNLKNFTEDKRKYAHATAFLSLNQTSKEKRLGIMRIGMLLARVGDWTPGEEVIVLQCLERGRPMVTALWG